MKEIYLIFKKTFQNNELNNFDFSQGFLDYLMTGAFAGFMIFVIIVPLILFIFFLSRFKLKDFLNKDFGGAAAIFLVFAIGLPFVSMSLFYHSARMDYLQFVLDEQFLPKLNEEQIKFLKKESFKLNQNSAYLTAEERLGFQGLSNRLKFNDVEVIMSRQAVDVIE